MSQCYLSSVGHNHNRGICQKNKNKKEFFGRPSLYFIPQTHVQIQRKRYRDHVMLSKIKATVISRNGSFDAQRCEVGDGTKWQ